MYTLSEARYACSSQIGRKAKTLAGLYAKGFRVCEGMILNTDAFCVFCESNGWTLGEDMAGNSPSPADIRGGRMPASLLHRLQTAYETFGKHHRELIVRSSAVEEDGAGKSFAGIFESCMHIRSFDQLIQAVKIVWASYFSEKAAAYRNAHPRKAAMAVLIQPMLPCVKSGVLFTRNPLRLEGEMVLEFLNGTNEGVTGGEEAAGRYRIERRSGRTIEQPERDGLRLTHPERRKLLHIGETLEQELGYPCDMEWGIWNRKIWIFQVRPMTAQAHSGIYHDCAAENLDAVLLDRYAQPASVCYLSLLNSWQQRVYLSFYQKRPGHCFSEQPLRFVYNRVYWNVRYQKQFFEDPADTPDKQRKIRRLVHSGYRSWYRRLPAYERRVELLDERVCSAATPDEWRLLLDKVIDNFCGYLGADHFRFLGIAQLLYKRLPFFFQGEGSREGSPSDEKEVVRLAETVVGKFSMDNMTIRANQELQRMATWIRQDKSMLAIWKDTAPEELLSRIESGDFSADIRRQLNQFLQRHGHRGVSCDDLYEPHWREKPENVVLLLKQMAVSGLTGEGPGETGWEALENELFEQLGPISPKRRKNLRAFIRLTGEYMRLRENQRYYFDKSWVLLRRLLLKIGERWAMDGRLGIREDIFHLSIEEIQTALECPHYLLSRETVEARKRLFEKEQETTPPYLWKDSEEVTVQKGEGYASYKGTGISLGCARGPARRLQSIRDIDDVRQGDICVVDTFHPSWTPALKMAAGLIMSYGNMLSHGAVVAREYGIPVVVFNGDALRVFRNGDWLDIRGNTGRIRIVQRASAPEGQAEGVAEL